MTGKKKQYLCTVLCSIIVASVLISDVNAKSSRSSNHRTSYVSHHSSSYSKPSSQHHSYPTSSGHSGHSTGSVNSHRHSYPASPSHSGNSGASVNSQHHSYPVPPSHAGNSGSSAVVHHNYPQTHSNPGAGQSHGYPAAPPNTMSGGGSGSSVHSYPSTNIMSGAGARPVNVHTGTHHTNVGTSYPSTNTMSGSGARPVYVHTGTHHTNGGTSYPQNYPSINTHQSTSWGSSQPVHHVHTSSQTVHHHHYIYRPPSVIHYSTSYGVSPVSYPIYTGVPPPYVYEYRSSGNKYSSLLAGLALYNLGRMSATPRANNYHQNYIPKADEYCRFGVRHRTGAVEEMNIDCRAITYFIFETVDMQPQMQPQTQTHVSTNTVNQTTVTTQTMYPNGSLVNTQTQVNTQTPVNVVNGVVVPNTQQILSGNGAVVGNTQQVNTMTTTTTQVLSVTDSRLSGKPVQVNSEMECYVTRVTSYSNMRKPVPCGLLQEYAQSSLRRSSAVIYKSCLPLIVIAVAFLFY